MHHLLLILLLIFLTFSPYNSSHTSSSVCPSSCYSRLPPILYHLCCYSPCYCSLHITLYLLSYLSCQPISSTITVYDAHFTYFTPSLLTSIASSTSNACIDQNFLLTTFYTLFHLACLLHNRSCSPSLPIYTLLTFTTVAQCIKSITLTSYINRSSKSLLLNHYSTSTI